MDLRTARRFADAWYAAWNAHDLEAILEHYTDDVELTSPFASGLAGAADGRLLGKEALRAYFAAGLQRFPELRFDPINLYVGVDSLVLHYVGPTGAETAEIVFLDGDQKIVRYFAHYTGQ